LSLSHQFHTFLSNLHGSTAHMTSPAVIQIPSSQLGWFQTGASWCLFGIGTLLRWHTSTSQSIGQSRSGTVWLNSLTGIQLFLFVAARQLGVNALVVMRRRLAQCAVAHMLRHHTSASPGMGSEMDYRYCQSQNDHDHMSSVSSIWVNNPPS
jgi:hypothetical protein